MSIRIVKNGNTIKHFTIDGNEYRFRCESQYAGPLFHIRYGGRKFIADQTVMSGDGYQTTVFWGVRLGIKIKEQEHGIMIDAFAENEGSQLFELERLSLMLGLDTCMDCYPEWNNIPFPTLLRCEKTHFWGYFRTPNGQILGIACPDAVDSWAMEYNQLFPDFGHLVYTVRLDLMNNQKQPARHPAYHALEPHKRRRWRFYLFIASSVTDVLTKCSRYCDAPMFIIERTIIQPDEPFECKICSPVKPTINDGIITPDGENKWSLHIPPCGDTGLKQILASADGHESELIYASRRLWSFYLKAAAAAALDTQKTGSHCESWYGFFTLFQAARFFPDEQRDAEAIKEFKKLLPLSFDIKKCEPTILPNRIQNTAILISLCEDVWRVTHDEMWLNLGNDFVDYIISHHQSESGAFLTRGKHYTCVIYLAKCIMELVLAERMMTGDEWSKRTERHFSAAKAAIDELVRSEDDIGTEGEQTFEDGMISCEITQIAMMGLMLPAKDRKKYIDTAEKLLKKHRCLERLGSPDARCRNTTIRFWEAQYDVLIPANMISSAHGWSAWKIYGVWYLYLLTGKAEYLKDVIETLGSCMNLIDENGNLRWAFAVDPCIDSGLWMQDKNKEGYLKRTIFGETYVNMISSWYRAPEDRAVWAYRGRDDDEMTDRGGCCDNDVHECFKALTEVALPYAYVYSESGELYAINADIRKENGAVIIMPHEEVVYAVHVNFTECCRIRIHFNEGEREYREAFGWLYADGHVSDGLPEER